MAQTLAYQYLKEAQQTSEDTQRGVKDKYDKLMIENRKLGEEEDEVKHFREVHNKLVVLATTREVAMISVPRQRMPLAEQTSMRKISTRSRSCTVRLLH